jgi:hypothetical protein
VNEEKMNLSKNSPTRRMEPGGKFTHKWIGRNFLPERHGQMCRIKIKAKNSRKCLLEFEDGYLATSTVALLRRAG